MAKVIRAIDQGRPAHFNLDDVSAQAEACLAHARAEVARLLADAADQVASIRSQAEADGRAAAVKAIEEETERRLAERFLNLESALRQFKTDVDRVRHDWLAQWEASAVKLGLAIARRVIRRELAAQPEIPLTLVREALQLTCGATRLRLLMNPDDIQGLETKIHKLLAEQSSAVPVMLVAEPSITRGGCRVETEHGAIDQQIDVQLTRIADEIS